MKKMNKPAKALLLALSLTLALGAPAKAVTLAAGPSINAESESQSESKNESKNESESESESESKKELESESESQSESESESEPESESESESEKDELDPSNFENKNIYNFVYRMYQIVLLRDPDINGLKGWYNALESGKNTGADIMKGFFFSEEFIKQDYSDMTYISLLYKALFNREGDAPGIQTWKNALDDGVSRLFVCSGFIGSDEYHNMCESYMIKPGTIKLTEPRDKNLDVTRFVSHFYTYCLGRKGDEKGLNEWTKGLLDHTFDGAYIASGFIFSDEFQNKHLSDTEFVETLYQTILGRPSDPAGLESWLKLLDDGLSKAYILDGFINSREFSELCEKYGISRGDLTLNAPRDQKPELTAFMTNMYEVTMKRKPSADELNAWTNDLLTRRLIAEEMADAFFNSAAYLGEKNDDETFVKDLYKAILRRDPSAGELAEWTKVVRETSRTEAMKKLIHSQEAMEKLRAVDIIIIRDGWIQENGQMYYYENGQKHSGWLRYGGKRYYLNPAKGNAQEIGWEYVDGYKLYFNNNGELVEDVDYLIGHQSSYLIQVYKWGNYVIVFAPDAYGNYCVPVKAMICSCGVNTPEGDYWSPNKFRWLTMVGGSKAQWCTQISGSYLFHSIPYRYAANNVMYTDIMYNYLGTTQSLGCIRLQAGDAKWVYDNCDLGTHININPYVNEGPFDKPVLEILPAWHTWDPTDPTAAHYCDEEHCRERGIHS